jgi:DNA-binding protein H-NS
MATLTELEQQLAELTAKVDAARADLHEHAVVQIKLIMAEYFVSASDLADGKVTLKATKAAKAAEPKAKSHKAKANGTNGTTPPKNKGTRPAKYIDPDTGATWSGMGHTPAWLKEVKNREKYLIQ